MSVKQAPSIKERPSSSLLVFNSRPFTKIKRAINISNHVGFGFSNRDMIFLENNSIENNPITSPHKLNCELKINQNKFGDNIFFNGDIKSLKLIGPPSKENRINNMIEGEKLEKDINTIDDLKNYIKNNEKVSSNYLNFVDKSKMNENDMISFYKAKRRVITDTFDEIAKREEFHTNKIPDNSFLRSSKISKSSKGDLRNNKSINKPMHTKITESSNMPIMTSDNIEHL